MDRFQEFCDAVLNSEWNQDLNSVEKGKLAIALLAQRDLFEDIMWQAGNEALHLDRANR